MATDLSFQPLLFGGDINVYSVARAFHEAYGIKSIAYGKFHTFPCAFSAIIDYRTCPENEEDEVFLQHVNEVCAQLPDKTVLVIGCGDSYVQLAARYKDQMPANAIAPYIPGDLLDRLINKEYFYQLCDQHGIDHPATVIYDKSMGHDFDLPWGPPYIAKPADGVAYWPGVAVDSTAKTQFIFKISRGIKELSDNLKVNEYMPHDERPVQYQHMIYFGDGMTDVPSMVLVRYFGGHSIAVFADDECHKDQARKLIEHNRVDFIAKADYSEGGEIYRLVKSMLEKMKADYDFDQLLRCHKASCK